MVINLFLIYISESKISLAVLKCILYEDIGANDAWEVKSEAKIFLVFYCLDLRFAHELTTIDLLWEIFAVESVRSYLIRGILFRIMHGRRVN